MTNEEMLTKFFEGHEIRLDVPFEPHFRGMAGNGEMMQWLGEQLEEDIYTEPTAREMREPSSDGAPAEVSSTEDSPAKDLESLINACENAGYMWEVKTTAIGHYRAHVQGSDKVYRCDSTDSPAAALREAYMDAKDPGEVGPVDTGDVDALLSADGIDMWDESVAAEASIPSLLVAHRVAGARQETWRTRLIAEAVQEREGTVTEEDIPDETMADVQAEVDRRLETATA